MQPSHQVLIIKTADGLFHEEEDAVASETSVALSVNGRHLVSLLCSPTELDCLAIGFLVSEGILRERSALLEITVDEKAATIAVSIDNPPEGWQDLSQRETLTSGCGRGVTFTDAASLPAVKGGPVVTPAMTLALISQFSRASTLFKQTGGVHSAALADQDQILLFCEDIGRHNAVDKLIGKAFLNDIPVAGLILLSSGRVSGEIMNKVIRSQIPILVSRSAPTCMSISRAEDHGITLIGFARANRMNIYSHPQRVKGNET